MIWRAIENEKDVLSRKFSCQHIQKDLETGRIRSRHNQIRAAAILGRDRAVQINVFADQLGRHFWPRSNRRPAWPGPVHAAETRLISKHDAQTTTTPGGCPPGFPHSIRKAAFLKASCAKRSRFG